jgi:opacity protein-like surface antigen
VPRFPPLLVACSATVILFLAAPAARAFERQWHAGIDGGYASLFNENSVSGFGGGLHLGYGLSDVFNALLELDVTRHPGAGTDGVTMWSGGIGVAYTLDVARAVPYGGLLLGGYRVNGQLCTLSPEGDPLCGGPLNAPGLQFVLGLDYQLERNWAIGVQLRFHTIFAADPVGVLAYGTTFLRVEYLWGF